MYIMLEASRNVTLHAKMADGTRRMVTFVPGVNIIDDQLWKALVEGNAKRFENHFGDFLHPFESKLKTECRADLNDYSEAEMIEIIDNCHTAQFLDYLLHVERDRTLGFAPRKRVIDFLLAKIPPKEIPMDELNAMGAAVRKYVFD